VEVKARFDEANNIEWGQMMEDAGVHVAYGLVGLKTHAKAHLDVLLTCAIIFRYRNSRT
jgi:polyphosphate kinase